MTSKKILIIDDDRDIVEAMEAMLATENYSTSHTYSGLEGLRKLDHETPHLILLDYMLPDILGKEVAEKIRFRHSKEALPIILVSAASNAQEIARKIPVNDFLEKPFDMDQLLATVSKHLS